MRSYVQQLGSALFYVAGVIKFVRTWLQPVPGLVTIASRPHITLQSNEFLKSSDLITAPIVGSALFAYIFYTSMYFIVCILGISCWVNGPNRKWESSEVNLFWKSFDWTFPLFRKLCLNYLKKYNRFSSKYKNNWLSIWKLLKISH